MDKDSLLSTSSSSSQSQKRSVIRGGNNILKLFLGILCGLVTLGIVLFLLITFHVISFSSVHMPKGFLGFSKSPDEAVAIVGSETLYQKDLNTELAYYPPQQNIDRNKVLLQKLVKDSITLQAGKTEGLIALDARVFNSNTKDYTKRLKLVAEVKQILDTKRETLSGEVLSVWFYNGGPGKMGYLAGKDYAHNKIMKLHQDVVQKKITMEQAATEIMSDSSLKDIDPAYKANAVYAFSVGPDEKIVFDDAFNAQIRALPTGGITDVYLARDKERKNGVLTDNMIAAVYMFARVRERHGQNKPSYDNWYKQKATSYEVTYK